MIEPEEGKKQKIKKKERKKKPEVRSKGGKE